MDSEGTNIFSALTKRRRRPWTQEEDDLLIGLISRFGDARGKSGHWSEISRRLQTRTPKECRKRWFLSLDPRIKRGKWTAEEDNALLKAFESLGPQWKKISEEIPGRVDDQCARRFYDVLSLTAQDRLRPWTPEEDRLLANLYVRFGGPKWRQIAREMNGRTGLVCRNRWRKLQGSNDISCVLENGIEELVSNVNETSIAAPHLPQMASPVQGSPLRANKNNFINGVNNMRSEFTLSLESNDPCEIERQVSHAISEHDVERLLAIAAQHNRQIVVQQHLYPLQQQNHSAQHFQSIVESASKIPDPVSFVDLESYPTEGGIGFSSDMY